MTPIGEHGPERLVDGLLAVVFAAVGVASVLTPDGNAAYTFPAPNAALVTFALAAALALALRRRWPLAICVAVCSLVFTIGALRWNAGNTSFFILVALYTVAAWRALPAALAGLGFAYSGIAVLMLLRVPYFDHPLAVLFVATVSVAWGVGRIMRRHRQERDHALARALAIERLHAVRAERAVLAERLHLARELHDVVSHTLSVIAVQSGSARHRMERGDGGDAGRRGGAVAALAAIETASRSALDDLRRMLGVLRADPLGRPAEDDAEAGRGDSPQTGRNRQWQVDGSAAVVLAGLGIGLAFTGDPFLSEHFPPANAFLVVLILAGCLPLVIRRRWPVPVYLVSLTVSAAITAVGWDSEWPGLASYVALYGVAAWRSWPVATAGLVLLMASEGALWFMPSASGDRLTNVVQAFGPYTLGLAVRRWRHERDAAVERALAAERTRAAAAERAVCAERLRIAGELHDVVSHTLSAIAVQAAVAHHQAHDAPGPAAPALTAIEEASRTALEDLRRMLGVLHDDTDGERASLSPTPGLAELALLASAHRAAYGPVELTVDPAAQTAAASVQLTTFRLVQEALTNVRKHAPGAAVRVTVCPEAGGIAIVIENDGPATAPASGAAGGATGFGLTGMRERVALFGGSIAAAPRPCGGFRVEAILGAAVERAVPA